MKITEKWLQDKNACESSFNHVKENGYINLNGVDFVKKLIRNKRLSDANWLIVRIMNKKQKVEYAIFAAEQAISIFEKKYPEDNRPRNAINAAKKYLKNPCKKTKNAADAAADAADAAAYAAYAAYATDATDATYAAAYAAAALKIKILNNGLEILKCISYM